MIFVVCLLSVCKLSVCLSQVQLLAARQTTVTSGWTLVPLAEQHPTRQKEKSSVCAPQAT